MKKRIFYFLLTSYLILVSSLVLNKLIKYEYNFTSLINIWQGFDKLNPDYFEKNSVIFRSQGYDGQFFYLIAKYLFNEQELEIPKLDSFTLRFSRISLPILSGFFSYFFSFQYYTQISLTILFSFHFLSIYLFYSYEKNLLKVFLLLFSPYLLSSNFLLVADGLLASFLILFYLLNKYKQPNLINKIFLFALALCIIFSKEVGILFIGYYFIQSIIKKEIFKRNLLILVILFYIIFKIQISFLAKNSISTNELSFFQLTDYPLMGFVKSFTLESFNFKLIPKTLLKLLLIYSILLIIPFKHKFVIEFSPLYLLIFITLVAEQGYWFNLDNLLRLFTLIFTWYILITKTLNLVYVKVQILIILLVIFKISSLSYSSYILK